MAVGFPIILSKEKVPLDTIVHDDYLKGPLRRSERRGAGQMRRHQPMIQEEWCEDRRLRFVSQV